MPTGFGTPDRSRFFVATCRVDLFLPASHSLKEKRGAIRAILARARRELNVSAAEVGFQDQWQRSVLVAAAVAENGDLARQVVQAFVDLILRVRPEVEVLDWRVEVW